MDPFLNEIPTQHCMEIMEHSLGDAGLSEH